MTFFLRHKRKIIFCAGILLLVMVGFWLDAQISLAQGTPAPTPPPTKAATIAGGAKSLSLQALGRTMDIAASLGTIYLILFVIFNAFWLVLGYIASGLNYFFTLNLILNPGQMLVVQTGWAALRDVANGVFILIVLWIAFTVIFNLENWGGRKLLFRVIVVALLINFSLVMVSAIFALANKLAEPFPKALGLVANPTTAEEIKIAQSGISGFIITNSKIQTIAQLIKDEGVLEAFKKIAEPAPAMTPPAGEKSGEASSLLKYVGIPDPVSSAEAQGKTAAAAGDAASCLIGLIAGAPGAGYTALCLGVQAAIYAATAIAAWWTASGLIQPLLTTIMNLIIADAILGLTALSLLMAMIILMVRLVAMVFLGVFAPVAFLSLAIPRFGDRVWNAWVENLFRWAFVAPIFYFLLYLALFVLQKGASAFTPDVSAVPLQANIFAMLNLVFFLTLLWASVILTRKAAGMGAEAALSFSKKAAGFGLGIATGGIARGAGVLGRLAAPAIEKTITGITKVPILSTAAAPLTRRGVKFLNEQRADVNKIASDARSTPADLNAASYRSAAATMKEKIGLAMALKDQGKFDLLTETEKRQVIQFSSRLGMQNEFLNVRPDLATAKDPEPQKEAQRTGETLTKEEAVIAQARTLKGSDIPKVSKDAIKGNEDVRTGILMNVNFSPSYLSQISTEDLDAGRMLTEHIDVMYEKIDALIKTGNAKDTSQAAETRKILEERLKPRFEAFLAGTPGQGLGLDLPRKWREEREQKEQREKEEEDKKSATTGGSFG